MGTPMRHTLTHTHVSLHTFPGGMAQRHHHERQSCLVWRKSLLSLVFSEQNHPSVMQVSLLPRETSSLKISASRGGDDVSIQRGRARPAESRMFRNSDSLEEIEI